MMMIIDAVVAEQKKQSKSVESEMHGDNTPTDLNHDFVENVVNNPNQYK